MALKFLNNATFAGAVSTGGYLTLNSSDSVPRLIFNGSGDDFFLSNTATYFGLYNSTDSRWDIKVDGAGDTTFSGDVTTDGIFKVDTAPDDNILEVTQSGRKMALKTSFAGDTVGSFWAFRVSNGNVNGGTTDALIVRPQNATFAGNVTVGHDLKMSTNGEIDWNAGAVKLIGTADDIKLQGGSLSITGDGSNAVTLTESGNGDFTIDAPDDIRLDAGGGDIVLKSAGTEYGRISKLSSDLSITSSATNSDILINPNGNGNVGIGTTSPSEKLDVEGNIQAINTAGSAVSYVDIVSGATWRLASNPTSGTNSYGLDIIKGSGGTDVKMSIDSSGSVGIGTTSPDARLEVLTTTTNKFVRFRADNNEQRFEFYVGASGNASRMSMHNDAATETIRFASAGNSYFNGGSVGIGTTSPNQSNLVVSPSAQSADVDGITVVYNPDGATNRVRSQLKIDDFNGVLELTSSADTIATYITAGGDSYFTAGNVGIGTTSPTSPLTIKSNSTSSSSSGLTIQSNSNTNNIFELAEKSTDGARLQMYDAGVAKIALYTDGTNNYINAGNVGIGTTSPVQKFHVHGGNINIQNGDGAYLTFNNGDANIVANYNGSGRDLSFKTYNGTALAEKMRIDKDGALKLNTYTAGTLVSDASGNITVSSGGGAGGPYLPLAGGTMTGNTKHNDNVFSYWGNNDDLAIRHNATDTYIENYTGDLQIVNYADDSDIVFKSDNGSGGTTEYFRLDGGSTMNVFSKPTWHGDGVKSFFGNSQDLQIYHDGSHSRIADVGTGHLVINATDFVVNNSADTKNMIIATDGGSVNLYYNALQKFRTISAGVEVTGNIDLPSNGAILFDNTNNTEQYYIRNGGGSQSSFQVGKGSPGSDIKLVIDDGGNVGIGTTAPSSRLTVQAAGSQTTQRAITIFHDNTLAEGYASIGAQYTATNGYIDSEIRFGSETLNGACSFMSFATGCNNTITQGSNSERMRITSGGNVGIGTSSPVAKFHVYQNDTEVDTAAGITIEQDGTGDAALSFLLTGIKRWRLGIDNSDSDKFKISTSTNLASNNKVTIDTNGNVGIGTTSPTEKLHVEGNIEFINGGWIGSLDGSYWQRIRFEDETPTTTNAFNFETRNGSGAFVNHMTILNNGNVGIGTSSPNQKLQVGGNLHVYDEEGDTDASIFLSTGTSNVTTVKIASNGDSYINGGNVGIGTTSPAYKLDVNGGIQAGGKVTYTKQAGSLDTTGYAVAGITALPAGNGFSCGFTFTCFGGAGKYQKLVYSCYNSAGTWNAKKVIDEGTNDLDIVASANGATITFTFKARSSTQSFTPRVTVEAVGISINSTYA